jgi:hypothetical protein
MRRTRDRSDIVRDLERDLEEEDRILRALERDLSTESTVLHRIETDFAELRETLAPGPPPPRPSGRLQAFAAVLVAAFVALAGFAIGRSVEGVTSSDLSAELALSDAKVASLTPLVNSAYEASDLATGFREAAGWRLAPLARSAYSSVEAFQAWRSGLSIPALTVWATGGGPQPPTAIGAPLSAMPEVARWGAGWEAGASYSH